MPSLDLVVFMLILGLMFATCASKCPRIRKIKNVQVNYGFQKRLAYFRCRKKGFDLIGSKSAVCNGNKWSTEFPICIAPGCTPLEYDKNVLDVTYTYRGSLATFQCKANYVMKDKDNRVYCNKSKWNKLPPICTKNLLEKSCNYEDGICGWTQDWSDQFDWKIHSKETSTKFTGPSNDHTYGSTKEGHYIYIEASAPRRQGDRARLLSPLYNFEMKAACFEFWFHMWCPSFQTKEVGSLQIYAIPENKSSSSLAPLQTLTGDYGNSWNHERIQIDPIQGPFQIVLQATRGLNHQNDIAVDDVLLWEGVCDGNADGDVERRFISYLYVWDMDDIEKLIVNHMKEQSDRALEDKPPLLERINKPTNPSKSIDPLSHSTEISTKSTTLSSSLADITVDSVITGKETIPTILSNQPSEMTSAINTPVHVVMTDKEIEPITTQTASKEILVTRTSSSTEMKPTERRVSISNANISETTDIISRERMDYSTIAKAEDRDNISNTSRSSLKNVMRKVSTKNLREHTEDYSSLAIGVTVALLFGIFVIFFIVWIWARSQDRKREMAEDEEETQPITNTVSMCSVQNSFS